MEGTSTCYLQTLLLLKDNFAEAKVKVLSVDCFSFIQVPEP